MTPRDGIHYQGERLWERAMTFLGFNPPKSGVVLREVAEGDLPVFYEQQLDPAANRMAAFTAKDPSDREAFTAHWNKILGDRTVTLRTILSDGHVVGYVGKFEERVGKPEVTYWIGREYWGRGIATNALSAFLDQLKPRPVFARAARDNAPSLRVLEKCGFRLVGYETSFANARSEQIEEATLELGATPREAAGRDGPLPAVGSDIRVRPAIRQDIPAIVNVSTSSTTAEEDLGFGASGPESPLTDPDRLSAAWQDPNLVRGEEVLVAELGGRVVGCVTVQDRGEALELINIDVPRELHGRGIGTRMVRYVEDRARAAGKRAVTLGTSRSAAGVPWKSLPWWQAQGYRVTHEEENAWTRAIGPGVREIRMRKDLP